LRITVQIHDVATVSGCEHSDPQLGQEAVQLREEPVGISKPAAMLVLEKLVDLRGNVEPTVRQARDDRSGHPCRIASNE
jgi:hypothetical protein